MTAEEEPSWWPAGELEDPPKHGAVSLTRDTKWRRCPSSPVTVFTNGYRLFIADSAGMENLELVTL